MKKTVFTLGIALLAATGAWAQTTFTADNLIYTVTSSTTHTVEVTNFESGLARELNIPATVTHEGTTYNVTSIRNWVFYNCNTITAVTIPGSVTSIGESAFKECKALTAVTISEGVTTIKRGAFTECSALTAITIPESVTSIGESTFKNCFALTTINIPTNLTKIEKYMFEGCKALTTITIPENVTSIGERVFYKCTSLTQINVDEANTAYCSENGVLFNKDKTTLICYPAGKPEASYTAPASLTRINMMAFSDCTALTEITLPEGLTDIEDYAFSDCTALTTINIPASLTSIGNNVFSGCTAITQIDADAANTAFCSENGILFNKDKTTLIRYPAVRTETTYTVPNSVTIIEKSAFEGNTALMQVTLPENLTNIKSYAFEGCSALTQITIPNNLTEIGENVFKGCTALTIVNIGSGVTSIGYLPFKDCPALTQINVDAANTTYSSESGVLFNKDKTRLICYPAGKPEASYTAPASLTRINMMAFSDCTALTEITLPEGMTTISSWAFVSCTALTTINIPASLTNMEGNAFLNCTALMELNVDEGNTAFCSENGVLFNKDKTRLLRYPSGKPETAYTVPNTVTTIGIGAFDDCTALTTVTLPESLAYIENYAFDGCTAITRITIPANTTKISAWAFRDCTAITQMTVLATIPPELSNNNSFEGVSREIPVYVPAASLTAYQAAEVWNEFTNLQAIGTTGLPTAVMPESIRMQGGTLHNPQGLHLTLYDMQGRQVYSGTAATVSQPAGVYVVRCAGASCKIVF